jgi:hypothetical protein
MLFLFLVLLLASLRIICRHQRRRRCPLCTIIRIDRLVITTDTPPLSPVTRRYLSPYIVADTALLLLLILIILILYYYRLLLLFVLVIPYHNRPRASNPRNIANWAWKRFSEDVDCTADVAGRRLMDVDTDESGTYSSGEFSCQIRLRLRL